MSNDMMDGKGQSPQPEPAGDPLAGLSVAIGKHDLFRPRTSRTSIEQFPEALQKELEPYVDDALVEEDKYPSSMLMNGKYILVPDHKWDYGERVKIDDVFNLNKVTELSIMGGPVVNLFEKTEPDKPAYVIFKYLSGEVRKMVMTID